MTVAFEVLVALSALGTSGREVIGGIDLSVR